MTKTLMRDITSNEWGITQLQNKILEIMLYIDSFCRENEIEYYLMGGTALGAKRHDGFIPWDDDLDIFMTPDNYERFRKLFYKKGNRSLFYLQEWGLTKEGNIRISKLRMNKTTYIEPLLKNKNIHHGIYVDIFILHTCPNSRFKQVKQYLWAKYVVAKGLSDRGYSRRRGVIGLLLKLLKILPSKYLVEYGLKQVYKYRNESSDYYCNFLGKAGFKNGIYKKNWFGKGKDINFETIKLKVPERLEDFLSERFGDYMKIPSLERIKWEQHAEKWDVNIGFSKYLKNINNYNDENQLY